MLFTYKKTTGSKQRDSWGGVWCLFARFFKAVCKLVSLSLLALPPVLFMSRRSRYLLRVC